VRMVPQDTDERRWTPRERVHLLFLVGAGASRGPSAKGLFAALRRQLVANECQTDKRTDWSGSCFSGEPR